MVLTLVMVATACASAETAVAPATRPTPSVVPASPLPAVTPAGAESPAPLLTPGPTATAATAATAVPELTPTPEPTPTTAATPTPTPEPTPEPTPTATATVVPDPLAAAFSRSSLTAVECPANVAAEQVSCAIATLPVDAANPSTDDVVEIMTAFVDNGDPDGAGPVVFLQGGPGGGSVTNASRFVGVDHDLLFIDQRGTGFSTPTLTCPEVDALWARQLSNDPAVRINNDEVVFASYQNCSDRLRSEGITLDYFNTTTAATDVELLRQLFGYEQWTLWGISYGTRIGLTVMRDYPDGVRAAVLDSVVPFEVDFFATIPKHGLRAVRAIDAACDQDQCANDHGDFSNTLVALVQRLDAEPVVVEANRPGSGEVLPVRVDGETLLRMIFAQMYSRQGIQALPRQVARADFGGLNEIVATYVTRRDPNQFSLAIGLYYTTWCREEFPFHDPTTDDQLLNDGSAVLGSALAAAWSSDGIDRLCESFAVTPAPPIEDTPLESDIPTLVFAGAFDPITPPEWSMSTAQTLANAVYVEMPDHGHAMATDCPIGIRLAFVREPLAALDTSCVAATSAPAFE